MKQATNIIRVFVGILFIISGLVKCNDPLGLSYKMQEFFEVWNTDLAVSGFFLKAPLIGLFHFLHEYSLALSVFMNVLEIMAGIALLVGWKRNFVVNLLFALTVFFTFLTAYAFLSGKFKSCGCFGDCLPIPPLASFLKDVVLTVLIVFLMIGRKYIQPIFTKPARVSLLIAFLIASIGLQWYALYYLPVVDCLPYKKGNNITEQMKTPAGAVPDSFAIRFIYEKEGKKFEFSPEQLPEDLDSYKFIDRIDKLVRKGNAEPPIKGFSLVTESGTDSTKEILSLPACIILFDENFKNPAENWMPDFKKLYEAAQQKSIPVFVATATSLPNAAQIFQKNSLSGITLLSCDNTAIRTAARVNPTVFLLKEGTIADKFSYKSINAKRLALNAER